ncbi:sporulation stage III protein AG [Natranaerobius thermophilus]|uniref:Sporulation stage III protein AG n=1 Tax=Natranaerobius thermophilus (strain ATCC BAA-1301 / DSM 18059 / JW/NM-WN-LF) TaxID=457570 RepID=B2A539_NATTJ|nr:sporulation stage III protein AG [Natranaerobius thermophilus]ACB85281.1 sporulation stage III protein AG [Natranaerobius thermophilus JW/NM-WN-LF]
MSQNPKELFQKIPPHLIVLGVLGLIFVIMGNPIDNGEKDEQEIEKNIDIETEDEQIDRSTEEYRYKKQLEQELEEALSLVTGAGSTKVMLSLKGSGELDLAKNVDEEQVTTVEADGAEGEREIEERFTTEEILTVREEGQEQPMVIKEYKPSINGIVIVAEGANNINVKKQLQRAATTLFDVPEHKIVILPKEN